MTVNKEIIAENMCGGSSATSTKVVKGEARVTYLKPKYAVLSKPGLDGGIFVVPSSVMGQQKGYPDMNTMIHLNDIVKFTALPQEEKNGIKWQALDGSVEISRRAEEVEYRGLGTVSFLDERVGQYGFIDSQRGSVWFNANVIRPDSKDVTKSFKKGQTVYFVAVENKAQKNQCKFRATLVHSKNYKRPESSASATNPSSKNQSMTATNNNTNNINKLATKNCTTTSFMTGDDESAVDGGMTAQQPQQPPKTQPLDIILLQTQQQQQSSSERPQQHYSEAVSFAEAVARHNNQRSSFTATTGLDSTVAAAGNCRQKQRDLSGENGLEQQHQQMTKLAVAAVRSRTPAPSAAYKPLPTLLLKNGDLWALTSFKDNNDNNNSLLLQTSLSVSSSSFSSSSSSRTSLLDDVNYNNHHSGRGGVPASASFIQNWDQQQSKKSPPLQHSSTTMSSSSEECGRNPPINSNSSSSLSLIVGQGRLHSSSSSSSPSTQSSLATTPTSMATSAKMMDDSPFFGNQHLRHHYDQFEHPSSDIRYPLAHDYNNYHVQQRLGYDNDEDYYVGGSSGRNNKKNGLESIIGDGRISERQLEFLQQIAHQIQGIGGIQADQCPLCKPL